jgi:hypothetical protein
MQKSIRQSSFAVIDMSNDTEISNVRCVHLPSGRPKAEKIYPGRGTLAPRLNVSP